MQYPQKSESIPREQLQLGRYRARFATTESDLYAVKRLRHEVFVLECGHVASNENEIEEDRYDESSHHLIVEHESGGVVGTYRLRTHELAKTNGFYSKDDFDLEALPQDIQLHGLEIGRACVQTEHRNGQVVLLLWKGIAHYLRRHELRYIFGCGSVSTTDQGAGWEIEKELRAAGHMHTTISLSPTSERICAKQDTQSKVGVPLLFHQYLKLGAKVCSNPALDTDFGAISFFLLLDTNVLDERSRLALFERNRWT